MPETFVDFTLTVQHQVGDRYPLRGHCALVNHDQIFDGWMPDPYEQPVLVQLVEQWHQATAGVATMRADEIATLGQSLAHVLFRDEIAIQWQHAQRLLLERSGMQLRLRLELPSNQPQIVALPWEYLSDSEGFPLALKLSIARMLPGATPFVPRSISRVLRVLLLSAEPQDQPALLLDQELAYVTDALFPLERDHKLELLVIKHCSIARLRQLLELSRHEWDVLHFIGHGVHEAGEGKLVFEHSDGSSELLSGVHLHTLLANSSIRLVVLNACDTGVVTTRALHSLSYALLAAELPAVITMQARMPDRMARLFSLAFYSALARSAPVDSCMLEARRALVDGGLEHAGVIWGLPVLGLRPSAVQPTITPNPDQNPFWGEPPRLVGRDDLLSRLEAKLRAGNHCSLVGAPGSGKTAVLSKGVLGLIVPRLGWPSESALLVRLGGIARHKDLEEVIAEHLGCPVKQLNSQLKQQRLRLLLLDNMGAINTGKPGYELRRWLRSFAESYGIRLVLSSNDRLDRLFPDDPTRDSPLSGLVGSPFLLEPLSIDACRELIQDRLNGTPFVIAEFADLITTPRQPNDLLHACEERFEQLRRTRR